MQDRKRKVDLCVSDQMESFNTSMKRVQTIRMKTECRRSFSLLMVEHRQQVVYLQGAHRQEHLCTHRMAHLTHRTNTIILRINRICSNSRSRTIKTTKTIRIHNSSNVITVTISITLIAMITATTMTFLHDEAIITWVYHKWASSKLRASGRRLTKIQTSKAPIPALLFRTMPQLIQ